MMTQTALPISEPDLIIQINDIFEVYNWRKRQLQTRMRKVRALLDSNFRRIIKPQMLIHLENDQILASHINLVQLHRIHEAYAAERARRSMRGSYVTEIYPYL